jgi:hypothetical protein
VVNFTDSRLWIGQVIWRRMGDLRRGCPLAALLIIAPLLVAQSTTIAPGLVRLAGEESYSKITYVRLALDGRLLDEHGLASDVAPPRLTAQCTKGPAGKLAFELLANFGGVDDMAYYPPWDHLRDGGLFPPQLDKVGVTMEFLGYTHVKPVKRQWEVLLQPAGQLRYNRPSSGSTNMEDSTYYLRFLLALPTLRLHYAGKAAEFRTSALLEQIRKEPVCKATGL